MPIVTIDFQYIHDKTELMFNRWMQFLNTKSTLLVGARRAGKTTYLKQQFPNIPYFTLDDYDVLRSIRNDPKLITELSDSTTVVIDEIQRAPEALIAIKKDIDETKRVFIMTGSSALGLLSAGSETLAGRIQLAECPTCCWGEEEGTPTHRLFSGVPSPVQIKQASRKLSTSLKYGGFPEVLTAKTSQEKSDILSNYKNSYFTKDLVLLSNIENADGLLSILHYLANSIGSHTEFSNISRESGLSFPTVKKYLNVLEASRLSFKLYGYQFGPAKRYIKAPKRYFCDNGMITALNLHISAGQLLENFVISEFEKRRRLGIIECDHLFYYQSTSGAEIDLIIENKNDVIAIEIKSTKKPIQKDVHHLRTFVEQDKKRRRGILFYMGDDYLEISGIRVIPIAHIFRAA